ncbi:MAG: S9 family peptidase [Saprospiraceae bacterium]|nr:prolyl oligopeptidase family serine peptidase [Bacteroidia bacterium]NNE16020.1 S9 family peptidase [Saprospiraceae bacterium]NNL90719.1 S9 family peptidase [Saprospiraceae bacterium]
MKHILCLLLFPICIFSQDKQMTPETWDIWNSIDRVKISPNGEWVSYNLSPGKGDKTLCLYNVESGQTKKFARASNAQFDYDNNFIAFTISPHQDSLEALERKKVKKDKMPKDTLGIYSLSHMQYDKIANVDSYKMPQKSGGTIAFKLHERSSKEDSTLVKKEGKKNGTQLFVFNHKLDTMAIYNYVLDYDCARKSNMLLINSTGEDSIQNNIISVVDLNTFNEETVINQKGEYSKFKFDESGKQLAFIADLDTSKTDDRPYEIMFWQAGKDVKSIANLDSDFLPENWEISDSRNLVFSDGDDKLYFGINPIAPKPDSTLLDSEKVELEIWNYKDGKLYTQQNVQLKREKDRSYLVQYDIENDKIQQLSTKEDQDVHFSDKFSGSRFVTYNQLPYEKYISWLGYAYKDVFILDTKTGRKRQIATKIQGTPRMSPDEKYVSWFSRPDTAWMAYNIDNRRLRKLTSGKYYNELHDTPQHPYPSGFMKWEEEDAYMYFYDQYDILKINPNGNHLPEKITNGRDQNIRYRYIEIGEDIDALPSDTTILLKTFNDKTKVSGYAYLNLETKEITEIESGNFNYTTRITKAENADKLIFTKQSFDEFPNLILTDSSFKKQKKISNANPQQKDYQWGSIELFEWTDNHNMPVQGIIAKPANFDPNKKYPLIINFYERSSNRLYAHRAPYPHRSTINYTYWTNKGYVIFNPDVRYMDGYPGQSCYDAVMSGFDALLKLGYIDESRVGLQGHSWGGYQIAHLLTKTDRFACAEAGAPVVNMISAYGGIRWGSGMSRQFQYERTQSRLGGTLWEKPELYLENSPVFNLDKVTTPVLILHNDNDGAVPWYQGIEYFVGLRRLGKPAWMLNYNDEPHWPLKRQNRIDFNKRLEQFFDHYLMDKPMPIWMKKGVPAVEREYNDGFEIEDK